jgi:short-subunit dehydrogenase
MNRRRAILTGASSGIGVDLARELAKRGYDLALVARRAELLDGLAGELTASGAKAVAIACDVTDAQAVHEAVRRAEQELGGTLDLAIANAGVSIPNHATRFNVADAEQVFRVNVLGVMYLYGAVVDGMIARKSGRFVGIASVAGLRGLPTSGPYSASKAAVQTFLEAARIELKPFGVGVTIVNPGFIVTPMTAKNQFHMPFLMKSPRAARIIADGIEGGKRLVEFPKRMSLLMRTMRLLPDALYERMMVPYARRKISDPRA